MHYLLKFGEDSNGEPAKPVPNREKWGVFWVSKPLTEDEVSVKKQIYYALHRFSSTFQISKCFWHKYLGKGQTRERIRKIIAKNFQCV